MSKKFAEKIIDSMVDENGNCGPRGLSTKQFNLIAQHLVEHEQEIVGSWSGDYSRILFTSTDYTGRIGKYYVELNEYFHFNPRCTVKRISHEYDESEEDLERAKMEASQFEETTKKFTENVIEQIAELDSDYDVQEFIRNSYEALVGIAYLYNSNLEDDPRYGVARTRAIFGRNEIINEISDGIRDGREYSTFEVGGVIFDVVKGAFEEN